MTDRLSVISCRGGLNEEASDIDVKPGEVRRSSNYEQVAEGGYRRVGGSVRWGGGPNTPDMTRVEVIEIDNIYQLPEGVIDLYEDTRRTDAPIGSGTEHVVLVALGRAFSTLLVVEKTEGTAEFEGGDVFTNGRLRGSLIALRPELTEAEQVKISDALKSFGSGVAAQPSGTGRVEVLQGIGDRMICGRRRGDEIDLQISSPLTRRGTWGTAQVISVGTFNRLKWDSCVYKFLGETVESAYLTNGSSDAIVLSQFPTAASYITVPGVSLAPTNVAVFQNHLFLGYSNGSVIHSDLGSPTTFELDGGEFQTGSAVTGFQVLPGNSLAIFSEDRIHILTGTSIDDFTLTEHSDDVGAIAGSIQSLPVPIFAAIRGISTLSASDRYGDFAGKTLSQKFNPLYQKIIRGSELYSTVNRDSSQYRLINSQGVGLYLTFSSNSLVGAMSIDIKSEVTAMGTIDTVTDGCFYGTADGWVYQMDRGNTFGGKSMEEYLELPYYHHNSPRQKKRFKKVVFGLRGDPRVKLTVTSTTDKGRSFHDDAQPTEVIVIDGQSQRHRAASLSQYDQYFEAEAYTTGTGINQSLLIQQSADDENKPHEIDTMIVHYTIRGQR